MEQSKCGSCRYWHSFQELDAGPPTKQTTTRGLCFANPPVLVSPTGPQWARPVTNAEDPECRDYED